MKKILTVGVFDYFHYGHVRLFKRAKKLGGELIVAIQDSDYILKYKPDTSIFYTTEQRKELVSSLKCVDVVIIYCDIDKIIQEVDFDIFAVGGDQNHAGFQRAIEWCKEHGKEIVRLERTPSISSSEIKENLMK